MTQLSRYHMMVVAKYFNTLNDFITVENINKRYTHFMELFHYNPIPLTWNTIKHFSYIETLHLYTQTDESFGNQIARKSTENNNEENTENKRVTLKVDFFQIVVWYQVTATLEDSKKDDNVLFKNVVFTKDDEKVLGTKMSENVRSIASKAFQKNTKIVELSRQRVQKNFLHFFKSESLENNSDTKKSHIHFIELPKSICSLGAFTFAECCNLKIVKLPRFLVEIGDYCFFNCVALEEVELPESLKKLGDSAFANCERIKKVKVPESVIEIGSNCFGGCKNLQEVKLHKTLRKIGNFAFSKCKKLTQILVPKETKCVGLYAFESDTKTIQTL
ncbi:hypothetical protein EIN_275710 [Entamoeba invadens IP1]|uniref:Leucine rich repeat containing protein BspA family protein n=1 Tax=Entamoeba invadens IP1 TaxID=370355 RepID=A0A0A1UEZ4_ENTIV|nr:hypothetical protein EIN_275710 [Entamoeba invadens IP1]ELP92512.1 hypothetical protein EIN_275710 [Entamoeba invadens IP1]|eukprot:XP_004259283.1 hypothetical protein EIN_275710 [Entamoeba invadens IP1]